MNNALLMDHFSCQGGAHKRLGLPLQDASGTFAAPDYALIFIADGHGGRLYLRSALGAQFAIQAGKEVLTAYFKEEVTLKSPEDYEKDMQALKKAIKQRWDALAEEDYAKHPSFEKEADRVFLSPADRAKLSNDPLELYGTTFIAYGESLRHPFSCALKIGDGDALFLFGDGHEESYPELSEHFEQRNWTSSLCGDDIFPHFGSHVFAGGQLPLGVFLASDGFRNAQDDSKFVGSANGLLLSYLEKPFAEAHAHSSEEAIRLSGLGYSDDVSFAFVLHPSLGDFIRKGGVFHE
jgi:hypothetical protein